MVNKGPALDRIFHALAHPVRRAMLERLAQGDASVGELGAPHGMSAPAISKHMKVLERAGLVRRTPEGRVHRVELRQEPLDAAQAWIARHVRLWEGSLDRLTALLEAPAGAQPPTPPPDPKE